MKREVLACGLGADGQLGLRPTHGDNIQIVPEHIIGAPSDADGSSVVSVACGEKHSVFLDREGKMWSVGGNDEGQLGRGTKGSGSYTIYPVSHSGAKIIQLAAGRAHTLAVAEDGRLFAWGSNDHGQLASPASVMDFSSPKRIREMTEVIQVACGPDQCIALCDNGSVFVWGRQADGANLHKPTEVKELRGLPIVRVAAGGSHYLALTVSGEVYSWGQNEYGQLGNGKKMPVNKPHRLHLSSLQVVEIAAGYSHSVLLTKTGRLLVFGSDHLGQLGCNKKTEAQTVPVAVSELMGSHVSKIACGRCHTMAVVNGRIFTFGLNSSGQLGNGTIRNQSVPRPTEDLDHVVAIFAGWDQSFIIRSGAQTDVNEGPSCPLKTPVVISEASGITDMLDRHEKMDLIALLESVFSSLSNINGSFLYQDERRFALNSPSLGINMDFVMDTFNALAASPDCKQYNDLIVESLSMSLFCEEFDSDYYTSEESLRGMLILPWLDAFTNHVDEAVARKLHIPFSDLFPHTQYEIRDFIKNFWRHLAPRHFNRIVLALLTGLRAGFKKGWFAPDYAHICAVLASMNNMNKECNIIPHENFYLRDLPNDFSVVETYLLFKTHEQHKGHNFSWYSYPFLLNGNVKAEMLHAEAILKQQMTVNQGMVNFFGILMRRGLPYFEIHVRRTNLVNDTVNNLLQASQRDLMKPLKVDFAGEEAEDGGGVKKEFFMLLFQQILGPEYGMFTEDSESHLVWFSGLEGLDPNHFHLLGLLSAMAVYNNVLVAFPFPLALYKIILGQKPALEDLCELSPTEGKGLQSLLDYEGDDCEDTFFLNFTMTFEHFGEAKTVLLKADGEKIAVNQKNKAEYVQLYVERRLELGYGDQIRDQISKFREGFETLLSGEILEMFQPRELQEMVIGNEHYDWEELRKVVKYNGEYHANHPTIVAFWAAFFRLNEDEKKQFMQFLMGTNRLPVQGISAVNISFQPCADHLIPVAHTCANLLDLPNLADEDEQLRRLRIAIQHTEGFTLV